MTELVTIRARRKLQSLQQAGLDAQAAIESLRETRRRIEANISVVVHEGRQREEGQRGEHEKLAASLQDDLKRIDPDIGDRRKRHENDMAVYNRVAEFARIQHPTVELSDVESPSIDGAEVADLKGVRSQITALKTELATLASAPLPSSYGRPRKDRHFSTVGVEWLGLTHGRFREKLPSLLTSGRGSL
jgi:hypothetical protein